MNSATTHGVSVLHLTFGGSIMKNYFTTRAWLCMRVSLYND